ncbi:MAG: UbiA family prenyltransferase [Salibacteraceae bacterium]
MITRSTLLHLRIPFSVFLLPVFCFAASQAASSNYWEYLLLFVILHLFLYPASNGYNSYYDKDEDSIGGLEKPPEVTRDLLGTSLLFDGFALLLGMYFGWEFVVLLLLYGLASKAYSHDKIRLKAYPIGGLLVVGFFQGAVTYFMTLVALDGLSWGAALQMDIWLPALLMTLLLTGSYPMTQIYQHEEDARRGDKTLSRILGIRGTFVFTALAFGMAALGFLFYFERFHHFGYFLVFQAFLAPPIGYFAWWLWRTWNHPERADFRSTMRLNLISSVAMIAFFTLIAFVEI